MMKTLLSACLGVGLFVVPLTPAFAQDAVHTNWRDNLAAGGMDVVTFFSGKPQLGKPEFSTRYKDADWFFFSQANKDLFLTNPEQFEPQYGGHCAWAISKGKLAEGNPEYWAIEDGRLYFNYNARIQHVWDRKRVTFINDADQKWPTLVSN